MEENVFIVLFWIFAEDKTKCWLAVIFSRLWSIIHINEIIMEIRVLSFAMPIKRSLLEFSNALYVPLCLCLGQITIVCLSLMRMTMLRLAVFSGTLHLRIFVFTLKDMCRGEGKAFRRSRNQGSDRYWGCAEIMCVSLVIHWFQFLHLLAILPNRLTATVSHWRLFKWDR